MSSDYGWFVPEDVLADALRAGLDLVTAAVTANALPDLVSRIWHNLRAEQRTQLQAWLTDNTVRIVHAYPLEEQEFPCWAIVLDPEQLTSPYLGGIAGMVQLTTGETVPLRAQRWQKTFGIITYTDNADLTRWLHHFVEFIFALNRRTLQQQFRHRLELAGRDLEPKQIAGRNIYRRVLQVTTEFDQFDASAADTAAITGFDTNASGIASTTDLPQ